MIYYPYFLAFFNQKIIYDLGCGPGNSTIILKNRWPTANIVGIDSSINMLEEARITYPEINFVKADIAKFSVNEKIDLICANASLQWLDNHETLLPHLTNMLNKGGALAIQMPNNFHAPTHQVTINLLNENSNWCTFLNKLRYGKLTTPFYHLPVYYDLLTDAGLIDLNLWETEYFQEMPDHGAIFDWVKGTGLRPVLSSMQENTQFEFAQAYIDAVTKIYPRQKNGKILLPFQRVFMVGYCGGSTPNKGAR